MDMNTANNDSEAYRAFQEYAEAKARVEQSMDFADAHIAGQAWVRFLNAYLTPEMRMPAANIIRFPRRAAP